MFDNFIFIINNKLHSKDYILYTITFYIVIIVSYYSLYINLCNNNYHVIIIYFSIVLLSYMTFKKFSYFIGYLYLIVASIINNYTIKIIENQQNNETIDQRIEKKRSSTRSSLEDDANDPANSSPESTPCESYILEKLAERKLIIASNKHSTTNTTAASGTSNELNLDTSTVVDRIGE